MRWFLLDRIERCEPGISLDAVKCFSRSELFFSDHFKNKPIVPAVLQIEMMAQAAGKCLRLYDNSKLPVIGSVKASKFYHNIIPGDKCHVYMTITKKAKSYALASGHVEVDGKKVSTATIMFALTPAPIMEDQLINEWKHSQGQN